MIIDTQFEHLPTIAACHQKAFQKSLSSAMGKTYLFKMLEWYLVAPHAFIFHIEKEGKCIAYCGGLVSDGSQPVGAASGMLQHSFNAALWAYFRRPWLLLHPETKNKYTYIWKNILYKLKIRKPSRPEAEQKKMKAEPLGGLVVIGVDPDCQGKGFGQSLLQEFERRALLLKVYKLQLTVKTYNAKAIRAYEYGGWKRDKIEGNSLVMYKYLEQV